MNDTGAKQQIVDTIQGADTILVTVSTDPSVDELSAALGLTMYLNELGKHATAVVSGAIPPAINFLEPEKTFEPTVDSLRDFVIALDKEKADHLRYKVEGDVVKIFITPYKTVISDKDLDFSQGDYNVEMVLALGVTDQDHLDKALEAHGKILHDATVATIGLSQSTLGSVDWVDESASSLSELAAGLAETLQDADKPITAQIASALLTGVVAATDRFSNDKTTSRTMSVSAALMAAGANQQLIASKLREGSKLPMQQDGGKKQVGSPKSQPKSNDEPPKRKGNGLSIAHAEKATDKKPKAEAQKPSDTSASQQPADKPAEYNPTAALDEALKKSEAANTSAVEQQAEDMAAQLNSSAVKTPEDELSAQLASVAPASQPPETPSIVEQLAAESQEPTISSAKASHADNESEPSFGGVLNATAEQAAADKRALEGADRNKKILSHGGGQYVSDGQPAFGAPLNGVGETGEQPSIDPFKDAAASVAAPMQPLAPVTPSGTLADIDQQNRAHDESTAADQSMPAADNSAAADAVNAVIDAAPDPAPFDPLAAIEQAQSPVTPPMPDSQPPVDQSGQQPATPGTPMTPPPPPMPDFSQLPPLPTPPAFPAGLPDNSQPQAPVVPSLPPFEPQAPEIPQAPLPPEQLGSVLPEAPSLPPAPETGPADPKQFKIPGQQ